MTVRFDRSSFSLPLSVPLRAAQAEISTRNGVALRLEYDGAIGYGEATPLEPWTESGGRCNETLDRIESSVADRSPESIDLPTDSPAARHGVTVALLDRAARMADAPLASYLGGPTTSLQTPVNATISAADRPAMLSAAEKAVAAGYDTLKCKVGHVDPAETATLIHTLRDRVGPALELRLDANQAWTVEAARTVLSVAADLDISYVEEPISNPTLDRLDRLGNVGCDIAVDESLVHIPADRQDELLATADVAVLKPMALGGLDRTIDIATRAHALDSRSVVTTTFDGAIARTAAVHVAAALPGSAAAGVATASRLGRDIGPDPIDVSNGMAKIPDRPGLGTDGPWHGGATP